MEVASILIIIGIVCASIIVVRILVGCCKVVGAGYHAF